MLSLLTKSVGCRCFKIAEENLRFLSLDDGGAAAGCSGGTKSGRDDKVLLNTQT